MPYEKDGSRKELPYTKRTGFKMAGFSAFNLNDDPPTEVPKGFYKDIKNAPQQSKSGGGINMQHSKTKSIEAGKTVIVYHAGN